MDTKQKSHQLLPNYVPGLGSAIFACLMWMGSISFLLAAASFVVSMLLSYFSMKSFVYEVGAFSWQSLLQFSVWSYLLYFGVWCGWWQTWDMQETYLMVRVGWNWQLLQYEDKLISFISISKIVVQTWKLVLFSDGRRGELCRAWTASYRCEWINVKSSILALERLGTLLM